MSLLLLCCKNNVAPSTPSLYLMVSIGLSLLSLAMVNLLVISVVPIPTRPSDVMRSLSRLLVAKIVSVFS